MQNEVKENTSQRLNLIASSEFLEQHIERIDMLKTIQTEMWSNYHLEKNPSKGSTEPATFSKINGALHCRVTVDGSITCSNISNGSGAVVDKFTIKADGTLPTDGTPVRSRH